MPTKPARRVVKMARGYLVRVVYVDITAGTVELLLRLPRVEVEGRNALHRALKQGSDVALCYEDFAAEEYEGELVSDATGEPKGR